MTQSDPATRVCAMLDEQRELLARVGEMALSQAQLIEGDDSERLLILLEQRSKVLDRATSLSREIEERVRGLNPSDPQLPLIARRRKEISDLAHAIAHTDRAHGVALSRKRDELARALAGVSAGRAAASAYAGARSPVSPGFQDRRA